LNVPFFIAVSHLDVHRLTLCDADEFIILGCDGIWDCLTNEKAVEFVRSRIQDKSPTEIGVEMLKTIISVDPRSTQGIGGDNMTIMIVDLQPQIRNYRARAASSLTTSSSAMK
jgi:serine/threonine protein phosphatase PrpC